MEPVTFDALTAAMIAHQLEERGTPPWLVARLLQEGAEAGRQVSRHGVRVKITGWSAMGEPLTPSGDTGTMTIDVQMRDQSGRNAVEIIGRLARRSGMLTFETSELGVSDRARFARASRDSLRLELRQVLPDSLAGGLSVLAGRPLSDLVDHPALGRPEAAGILITAARPPTQRWRTQLDVPIGGGDGADVEIATPAVIVQARS